MRLLRPSVLYARPILTVAVGAALVLVPLLALANILATNVSENLERNGIVGPPSSLVLSEETKLGHKIVELSERIKHAEMLNRERKQEIISLRSQIESVTRVRSLAFLGLNGSSSSSTSSEQSPRLAAGGQHQRNKPSQWSDIASDLLQVPSISNFLPNLLSVPDPLRPAFRRVSKTNPRSAATIVFGLPTVRRPVESYLLSTLANLINNLSPEEAAEAVLVIFIAETDIDYVEGQAAEIEQQFHEHIESGLLEIISPPASYYPDFNSTVKATLGDPLRRVIWRTKQNLDFAYLMMYCQPKGTYYVQLEDDILTKAGYLTKMKHFAFKQFTVRKDDWFLLDFCQLGFIGKMFKSRDLSVLALWFVVFRNEKPVDWLLVHLGETKYCRIDKDAKDCRKQMATRWVYYRPSLFQHIGTHSSLKGKVQKLRDKGFGKLTLFVGHKDNPRAEASSSLNHYKAHAIDKAYEGLTFFWGMSPSVGDVVTFNFTPPVQVDKFLFKSGNLEHPEDRFPMNSTVEVRPLDRVQNGSQDGTNVGPSLRTNDGFLVVGYFRASGVAEGTVPKDFGPLQSLRIKVNTDSQRWAILSEMMIVKKSNR